MFHFIFHFFYHVGLGMVKEKKSLRTLNNNSSKLWNVFNVVRLPSKCKLSKIRKMSIETDESDYH